MGCEDTSSCGVELKNLPLLTGCPADDEYVLVGNAEGGQGSGKYARRLWGDLKNCISSSSGAYTALRDTISVQGTTYTNTDLIGATELQFIIVNRQLYTFEDGDFSFNDNVGTISFLTITLFVGDKITIPYKSA